MGFNIGGMLKSIVNPMTLAQLAMGPAGWASILVKAVVSAVAQQVIQQIGQKLGLPEGVINMAQQAFSAASGGGNNALGGLLNGAAGGTANTLGRVATIADTVKQIGDAAGISATDQGQITRQAEEASARMVDQVMRTIGKKNGESEEAEGSESGGGSVLMRIARALGKAMDEKMDSMAKKGDQIGNLGSNGSLTKDGNFNAKGQSQYGKLTGEMSALGQELGMLSQALSSTLKSIGEAGSTVARKS